MKAISVMRLAETPSRRATSRFSATARNARPIDVRWTTKASAATSTMVAPITVSCMALTLTPPSV